MKKLILVLLLPSIAWAAPSNDQLAVALCDISTGAFFCGDYLDADGDGVVDNLDECPSDPNNLCNIPVDSDNDGVFDSSDLCPNTTSGAIVDANGCEIIVPDPNEPPVSGSVSCTDDVNVFAGWAWGVDCVLPSDPSYDAYGLDYEGFYTYRPTNAPYGIAKFSELPVGFDPIANPVTDQEAHDLELAIPNAKFHASGGGPKINGSGGRHSKTELVSIIQVLVQDAEQYDTPLCLGNYGQDCIESWGLSGFGTAQGVGNYSQERMCQLLDYVEAQFPLRVDWARGLTISGQSMGGRGILQAPMIMCDRWRNRIVISSGNLGHTLPRLLNVNYQNMGPDIGANSAEWDKMDFLIQAPIDPIVQNVYYVHHWNWSDGLGLLNPLWLDTVQDLKISGSFTWDEGPHGSTPKSSKLRFPTQSKTTLRTPFVAFTHSTADFPSDWYGKTVQTMSHWGHINLGLKWDNDTVINTASLLTMPLAYDRVTDFSEPVPDQPVNVNVNVTLRRVAFAPNISYAWVFGSQSGSNTTDGNGLLTINLDMTSGDGFVDLVVTK